MTTTKQMCNDDVCITNLMSSLPVFVCRNLMVYLRTRKLSMPGFALFPPVLSLVSVIFSLVSVFWMVLPGGASY